MAPFNPFADDAASTSIGKLTIENGTDRVALYGSLDLDRDQMGLERAQQLKALLDRIVAVLEAEQLPAELPKAQAKMVNNPFQ